MIMINFNMSHNSKAIIKFSNILYLSFQYKIQKIFIMYHTYYNKY